MKTLLILITVLTGSSFVVDNRDSCAHASLGAPERLVIIKGKVTILNHPKLGEVPDSGGTIIFKKVGCDSCFIGSNADSDGNYKVLVGDGKYELIVRNPSSPEVDLLVPDQERFVDTSKANADQQVFSLDVRIKLPKEN